MTAIVLGPMLRWVGSDSATVWLETDRPADIRILGHDGRTFQVAGHHYAVVPIRGLQPGNTYEYDVQVDGERVWPLDGMPPSVIRTLSDEAPLRVAFGSCRLAGPRTFPLGIDRIVRRYDPSLDALATYARRLMADGPESTPELLLLLGDQVYADDPPEATRQFARQRRDVSEPPGEVAADFEEQTHLYRESWSEPAVRWLFSTVPTAMIFDDHELVDDWQISRAYVRDLKEQDGWDQRLGGSLVSYWLYQHLGNLDPDELEHDSLYVAARADEDAFERLRDVLVHEHEDRVGSRWSFVRDLGPVRLVVMDVRATRTLGDDGRDILDEAEWQRVRSALAGGRDVVLASSVPVIYAEGFHHLQAWSERVAGGAWGSVAARATERLRRALSLSGWPAFEQSFERLMDLLAEAGSGRLGSTPRSITIVSGDVHHGYVARLRWPDHDGVDAAIHQVVSSPLRHSLMPHERLAQLLAASRLGTRATQALASAASAMEPDVRWDRLEGLEFANQITTLTIDADGLDLHGERVEHAADGTHRLDTMWRRPLVR